MAILELKTVGQLIAEIEEKGICHAILYKRECKIYRREGHGRDDLTNIIIHQLNLMTLSGGHLFCADRNGGKGNTFKQNKPARSFRCAGFLINTVLISDFSKNT